MAGTKESVLERVIREAENSPHPSLYPKEEAIAYEGPWFDIGRRAVEILTEPKEIKDFMEKYVQHICDEHGLDTETAKKSARDVVGYCTGYVDDEQANRWLRALPSISHPIMGRERPFKGGRGDFYIVGQSEDMDIRSFLKRRILEISGPVFEVLNKGELVIGRDNPSYFAIGLRLKPETLDSTNAYMFLAGITGGLPLGMKDELGKTCKLSLESLSTK